MCPKVDHRDCSSWWRDNCSCMGRFYYQGLVECPRYSPRMSNHEGMQRLDNANEAGNSLNRAAERMCEYCSQDSRHLAGRGHRLPELGGLSQTDWQWFNLRQISEILNLFGKSASIDKSGAKWCHRAYKSIVSVSKIRSRRMPTTHSMHKHMLMNNTP